jgi:cation transport ATPase
MVTDLHSLEGKGRRSSRRGSFSTSRARSAEAAALAVSQPVVRITPGREGVSIWSFALFGDPASSYIREFLSRVFSVPDVAAVEIHRTESFGRVHYSSSSNAPEIWRKLSRALERSGASDATSETATVDYVGLKPPAIESLYLDGSPVLPIWINRVGASLSTWRLRSQNDHRIRLTHPILLNRKDVAYRLEEELSAIQGIERFRTNTLTSSLTVRFNPRLVNADRLVRQLERSWPRLLDGLGGPPSAKRLVVAGGLLGLSFTGQYLVPALRPWGLLGVAAYGFPNVKNAAKQLAHWQIGLPALYLGGLALTLLAGMPFSSGVMAVFMQLWPRLTYQTMTRSQRRLFAIHRQRATWARVVRHDGAEIEVDLDTVTVGDLIAVREGEIIPVDGVVTEGLAAVDEEALSGAVGAVDKTSGDAVYSSTFVRDGRLVVRAEKLGINTVAGYIGKALPHSRIDNLLSAAEAERVANRNAKPTLALAGITLFATRRLSPAQAVVRPDYATGPRLGAQLAALHDLGDGLRRGVLFRDPAALDRLPATDVYVFDDTSALESRQIEVAEVLPGRDISADTVLKYAAAAFPASHYERSSALLAQSVKYGTPLPEIFQRSRHAGTIRFFDSDNHLLEIAAPAYIAAAEVNIPSVIAEAVAASRYAWNPHGEGGSNESVTHKEPLLRPIWVLRNGEVLGVVTFRRQGEQEGIQVIAALKARNKRARFVYISSHGQSAAETVADTIGISTVFGDLDPEGKARTLRNLGGRTMWIGDGTVPEAIPCIKASIVSISVAGVSTVSLDAADIVLLQPGLQNLVTLRRIGRSHRASILADYRAVYAANLLGAAGGLFTGFGSLESGLASNVGTGYVYARHWKQLRDLISLVEKRRAIVMSPTREESDHLAHTLHTHYNEAEQFVDYQDLDASAKHGGELHGV